ncbi:uncharacterized protein N7511_001720, partial [Penicillium nucicola]|uniref:uncharacterized protein n=1 Tax=Penicillium nucicola TaxID=1850975 RepID=UPI0025456CCE
HNDENHQPTSADSSLRVASPTAVTGKSSLPCVDTEGLNICDSSRLRYDVSMKAQTAMFKLSKAVPVTYLNMGQIYTLSVVDSDPPVLSTGPVRYFTYIRISFENADQRSKPMSCWELWEETQGLHEAHKRRMNPCAVEYVNTHRSDSKHENQQIHVENASVDGFCVTWTPDMASETFECVIPVRFNFLSTYFSHCKGVKGEPVRLCVKTEILGSRDREAALKQEPGINFCLVKVLRNHGAQRKLSNDIAHVEKIIQKLRKQIAQAKQNSAQGKRKRGSPPRHSNARKHKRTWPVNSKDGDSQGFSSEDCLQANLAKMQAMLTSTRSITLLDQRGDEQDSHTLFPLLLHGNGFTIDGFKTTEQLRISALSPTSELVPLNLPHLELGHFAPMKGSRHLIPVQKIPWARSDGSENFLKAVYVDPAYNPPAEQPTDSSYYRAIYLTKRTVREVTRKICLKQQIDPRNIKRIIRTNQSGIQVGIDDNMV